MSTMPDSCTVGLIVSDLCLSLWGDGLVPQVLGVLLFLIAFAGLAIAAEHLCNSMETLCDHWRIHEDVGGATFIALGGAIPEITINCIATMKSLSGTSAADASIVDLGVGAIMGSGLIAFLLIPSLSRLLSTGNLVLRQRALLRDSAFYFLALLTLLSAVYAGITVYHGPILVLLYVSYVLVLVYSDHLHFFWSRALGHPHLGPMFPDHIADATSVFREKANSYRASQDSSSVLVPLLPLNNSFAESFDSPSVASCSQHQLVNESQSAESPGILISCGRAVLQPLSWAIDVTCPDCRLYKPCENWYPLTFLTSIVWITLFSFLITTVVERWVGLLNIPSMSYVIGLILVAVGAEIPDAVNAVTIARRGFGGMAISACLGSQVVNICLGLGLPWMLSTLDGKTVKLTSNSAFMHSVCWILVLAVVVAVAVIGWSRSTSQGNVMEITVPKSIMLATWYIVSITCVILIGFISANP